jgi:hypothetical protein
MNDTFDLFGRAVTKSAGLLLAVAGWTGLPADSVPRQEVKVEVRDAKKDEKKQEEKKAEDRAAVQRERVAAQAAARQKAAAQVRIQAAAVAVQQRNVWPDEQFERWIFNQDSGAANARRRFESLLTLQVEEIDRACGLTDAQKQRIRLMGFGDVKRIFDAYDVVKHRFNQMENDMNRLQEVMPDIQPIQTASQNGPFADDSLLLKSLHHVLTPEQWTKYDAIAKDRRAYRHRARIELAVGMLEQSMPMRETQRRALIDLLVRETRPNRATGYYSFYVVMDEIGQMADGKAKSLFTEAEWKILNRQLMQYRGIVPNLRAQGLIDDDDDGDVKNVVPDR